MASTKKLICENELEAIAAVLEIIPLAALVVDSAGLIQVVNPALIAMFGYTESEIISKQPEKFLRVKIQKRPQTLRDAIFEVPDSHPKADTELVGEKRNGYQFSVAARLGILSFAGTRFGLAVVTDTIKSEADDKKLASDQSLASTVMSSLSSPICVIDTTGKIVAVNTAYRKFGLENGADDKTIDGIGINYFDSISTSFTEDEEYWKAARDGIKGVLSGNLAEFQMEYPCDAPDLPRWFLMNVAPIDGATIGAVISHTDITAQKNAVSEISASEARYRRLFESAKDGILILNAETGKVVDVNPFLQDLLGFPRNHFVDKTLRDLGFLTDVAENEAKFDEIRHKEYVRYENLPLDTSTGSKVDVEFISNIYLVNGKGVIHCNIRDVSEKFKAQCALENLNADLERRVDARTEGLLSAKEDADRANLAKNDFLSQMSHEFRTPLNAILGNAKLIELQYKDANLLESTGSIIRAGNHLLEMVNEILNISKIEDGTMSLSLEPVEMIGLINEAVAFMKPLADSAGVKIRLETSVSDDCCVHADHLRLLQTLVNLLNNAVKFNRKNGQVIVGCTELPNGLVLVKVSDTGCGISEENQQLLFRPFQRLGDSSSEGTGLGLALSMRFIKLMGGTLSLASSDSNGSSFQFQLNRVLTINESQSSTDDEAELPSPKLLKSGIVLIIEDSPVSLQLLRNALSELPNLTVISAIQASRGVEIAEENHPCIIFLDQHLPDMSGLNALRTLKSNSKTKGLPVVMISVDASRNDIRTALNYGAVDYLSKPLDINSLLRVVMAHADSDIYLAPELETNGEKGNDK